MPETLDIEAGSRTDRGLKFYRAFVEVYTLGGTCNMDRLAMIPKESEEIFLRQRADIPTRRSTVQQRISLPRSEIWERKYSSYPGYRLP